VNRARERLAKLARVERILPSIRFGVFGATWLALGTISPVALPRSNDEARERITRTAIEATVRKLAADELRGRRTGSPEAVLAARWLATELERAGVRPAGDAGTFLQRVPLCTIERSGAPRVSVRTKSGESAELVYGVDFDQASVVRDAHVDRLVVVAQASDVPATASTATALVVPDSREERTALFRAAGSEGAGFGLWLTLGPKTAGTPRESSASTGGLQVEPTSQRLRLRGPWRERALAGEIASLELVANAVQKPAEAYNVVGVVPGRGAKAEETVVASAHYDHIGVATKAPKDAPPGAEPDLIFNGADDDASGCAVLLALADALAHSAPPERTTVFFFATGEEMGLLGTDWYVEHPFVPLAKTVLNLNFEMLGRPDAKVGGPGRIWLTGDERSNLGAAFRERGLAIVADPRPEQHFFERSDNMAFVRKGVVGQSLSTYDLHTDYHRVSDEAGKLDYVHLEACARTSFDALELVLDDAFEPKWNPGQSFER
jgi:hypothetical protein